MSLASVRARWASALSFTVAASLAACVGDGVADASGRYSYYDLREGLADGQPALALYDTIQFNTAQGWQVPLNGATPNISSGGANGTYTYNHGYVGHSTAQDTDVSGLSIASVVQSAQDLTTNTASPPIGYRVSDG